MRSDGSKITYDPDADVLAWEMNEKPIAYAREIKNIIIHFSDGHVPVLVEVLEATQFLAKAKSVKDIVRELCVALSSVEPQVR